MSAINKTEKSVNAFWIVIDVLFLGIFAFFVVNVFHLYDLYVFHSEEYPSDLPLHIEGAFKMGTDHYSLNSVITRFLIRLTGTEASIAVWLTLLIIATCVTGAVVAWLFFGKPDRKYIPVLLLLGTAPWFMGAIYIPHFYEYHYTGTMAATAWHNTTLIEMRLFAILTLLFFYMVIKRTQEESGFFRMWIPFVIFLFLTTGYKTNFYISFCPLAGIVLIVWLILSLRQRAWKRTGYIVLTGLSILAVLPVLAYQGSALFDGGEGSNQVIISVGTVWMHSAPNVILKPLLSVLPFLVVFIYSIYKKRVTKEWMFLLGLYCIDVAVSLIFAESGDRMFHGNFAWGQKNSLFILNFVSLLQYCRYMIEMKQGEHQRKVDIVALALITIILFASIAGGILYFYKIAWGGLSYQI